MENNSPIQSQNVSAPQVENQPPVNSNYIDPNSKEVENSVKPVRFLPERRFLLILLSLFLITAASGLYITYSNTKNYRLSIKPKQLLLPTPTTPDTINNINIENDSAVSDWKTFGVSTYSIKYPKDLSFRQDEGSVIVLSKVGPTQTEGTEFFDGFTITFQPREIPDITPEIFAKTRIAEIENQDISKVTEEPKAITVNGYKGVTFTEESLGTFKHFILGSEDGGLLIQISVLVADPGKLGYQDTVDRILSTFRFAE